ncbi:hypothetical protein INR49_005385 [Caranx melampygus]|nr:hypothetical protein INR49_005385 [Caranx melampygus]
MFEIFVLSQRHSKDTLRQNNVSNTISKYLKKVPASVTPLLLRINSSVEFTVLFLRSGAIIRWHYCVQEDGPVACLESTARVEPETTARARRELFGFPSIFDTDAHQYWDKFYEMHQNKFFKDRRWLFLEFPELLPSGTKLQGDEQQETLVGCGVGNSVFPIVNSIKETDAFLYCCDFSPRAIQLVKDHPDYDNSVCHAFVHDLCEEMASFPFPPQSLDVILAVFVLSSIHPERVQGVVKRLSTYLKHGGIFLFRDYGRYDFSQLRFKKGRCLSENFYTRGDGTCVYFFTKEEVHDLFSSAGLEEIQNLEDRRLQVNRGKKVAMHRKM